MEDVAYFSNLMETRPATLPYDFLQSPLPDGLDLSSNCAERLDLMNIKTWDEFVSSAIYSMMSTLTIPVYFQHHKDLRRFFIFGLLYQSNYNSAYPTFRNSMLWIHQYCVSFAIIGYFSPLLRKLANISCLLETLPHLHNQFALRIHVLRNTYHHHPCWTLILQHLQALIHQLFHLYLFKLLLLNMFAVRGGYKGVRY